MQVQNKSNLGAIIDKSQQDLNTLMLNKKIEMDKQTDDSIISAVKMNTRNSYPMGNIGNNINVTA